MPFFWNAASYQMQTYACSLCNAKTTQPFYGGVGLLMKVDSVL